MRNLLLKLCAVSLLLSPSVALAEQLPNGDPKINEWKTHHSMGCMMTRDCKDGVIPITSAMDVESELDVDLDGEAYLEIEVMMTYINELGIGVYLADSKYFPANHRGVYYTVGNNFFLNRDYMGKSHVFLAVMRHEGWHAVQDCMAGTLDNSLIAIVYDEEKVPFYWRDVARRTYPESARAWEAEALWAGHTENITTEGLSACANEIPMWDYYPPTPMTNEWLQNNGYIK